MNISTKDDWLITASIIVISIIPVIAGVARLVEIVSGAVIEPENTRFLMAPWPILIHIICSTIYCILGAFQFPSSFRISNLGLHKFSGKILVLCGFAVALSGLWMTLFYPTGVTSPAKFDGQILYAIRFLMSILMFIFLCLGIAAIRRYDITCHKAWMIRSYAIGLGAGTQVFTHIPWFLFPNIQGELTRALLMGAGWVINLIVSEWVISREQNRLLS